MHNNLNILEMKRVLELQPFIPNASWLNIWVYDLSHRLKGNLSKYKKVNRKVQEEPQAEAPANPWHQEEEKKWHSLTCANAR